MNINFMCILCNILQSWSTDTTNIINIKEYAVVKHSMRYSGKCHVCTHKHMTLLDGTIIIHATPTFFLCYEEEDI